MRYLKKGDKEIYLSLLPSTLTLSSSSLSHHLSISPFLSLYMVQGAKLILKYLEHIRLMVFPMLILISICLSLLLCLLYNLSRYLLLFLLMSLYVFHFLLEPPSHLFVIVQIYNLSSLISYNLIQFFWGAHTFVTLRVKL